MFDVVRLFDLNTKKWILIVDHSKVIHEGSTDFGDILYDYDLFFWDIPVIGPGNKQYEV